MEQDFKAASEQEQDQKKSRLPNVNTILRRLIPIVCIGVLGNLAFSWYTTDKGKLLDWSAFSWGYLFVAFGLSMLPWFWHALRVYIWCRFFGVQVSPLNLLRIVVATDVGGVVAPVAVGGAPFKMGMLIQQGFQTGQAATLTLLGHLEEAVFFLSIIPVSLFLTRPWENPLWQRVGIFFEAHTFALLLGLSLLAGLVFFVKKAPFFRQFFRGRISRSERLQLMIADFRHAIRLVYSNGRKPFLLSMLAIIGQWMSRFAILLMVLFALGLELDFFKIFFLQWMVFVAMLFVPTPGGTGGAEAAFLLVFSNLIPRAAIGPAMAGWRLITYYFMLLVGVGILFATEKRATTQTLRPELK
jgi:uncharacterized protein (TIRG00374 family)